MSLTLTLMFFIRNRTENNSFSLLNNLHTKTEMKRKVKNENQQHSSRLDFCGETVVLWEYAALKQVLNNIKVCVFFSLVPFPKRPLRFSLIAMEKLRLSPLHAPVIRSYEQLIHALVWLLEDDFRNDCDCVQCVFSGCLWFDMYVRMLNVICAQSILFFRNVLWLFTWRNCELCVYVMLCA